MRVTMQRAYPNQCPKPSSLPFPFSVLINLFPSPLSDPTRSPTITPVIHLRRRKTLRMFLARRRFHPPPQDPPPLPKARVRHKLKDLFVSSPPPPLNEDKTIFHQQQQQRKEEEEEEENKDQPVELIPNRPEPPPSHRISLPGRSAAALRPIQLVQHYA
ncbi:hypothetical protein LR48_Vigan02g019700 [Vigna angularis]|uniref:Uncharacterized protein n=1 Tax=Phaseolus angularis TaxID=3914 RepID=A0A0L9TUI8_PHAAN|nr:hypothetical protein LR48_Vigan02g019700 [Vigna angularis]